MSNVTKIPAEVLLSIIDRNRALEVLSKLYLGLSLICIKILNTLVSEESGE